MSAGTRKVTRAVTRYETLNSTYEVDEASKEWRRVTGVNSALRSQGRDGEWKPFSSAIRSGPFLYIYHPDGMFRTSLIQSSEPVALTE